MGQVLPDPAHVEIGVEATDGEHEVHIGGDHLGAGPRRRLPA
jgi:hypothetical protein